jgi:protein-S-isoprenylcysteine O-methyltransferase Ste14
MHNSIPGDATPEHTFVDRSGQLRGRMRVMRFVAVGMLTALPFIQSHWPVGDAFNEGLESAGLVLLVVCIAGRVWCSAYIGGRKNYELVTAGPFSVVRNPLYLFSLIGVTGIGLLTGMLTVTILFWVIFLSYHHATILREEVSLQAAYGESYRDYMRRVPRWLPNPRLWQEPTTIEVQPRFPYLTLRDVGWILLLYPLNEGFDWLQESGMVSILLHLP